MMSFSKNKKLNGVLNDIYNDLMELGVDEVKHYYNNFSNKIDYNIAEYGNMLIYYDNVRELYKNNGYKTIDKISDENLWNIYKRQVGFVARKFLELA